MLGSETVLDTDDNEAMDEELLVNEEVDELEEEDVELKELP